MGYDKKIKYLDYLENGMRVRGGGFLKMELLEDSLKLGLTVKGVRGAKEYAPDVILCGKDREEVLGKINLEDGQGELRHECQIDAGIGGTEIRYAELIGIRIPLGEDREIACKWGEAAEGPEETLEGKNREINTEKRVRVERSTEAARRAETAERSTEAARRAETAERSTEAARRAETAERSTETARRAETTEAVRRAETAERSTEAEKSTESINRAETKIKAEISAEEKAPAGDKRREIKLWEVKRPMVRPVEQKNVGKRPAEKKPSERQPESIQRQSENLGRRSADVGRQSRDSGRPPEIVPLLESKWLQLCALYPHIKPFQDQREYLSIGPEDFVLFSSASYKAAGNSFMLHGYYNYRHLILAREERRGEILYYVGVPGNYYDREKQVAVMFGFESFECAQEPVQSGDYGYYMMRVEL